MLMDLGKLALKPIFLRLPESWTRRAYALIHYRRPEWRAACMSGVGRAHRMNACQLCLDARSFGWELGTRTNGRDVLCPYQ